MKFLTTYYFLYSFILLAAIVAANIFFDFNGLFGQDSYEYVKLQRGITEHIFSGKEIPYSVFPIGYGLTGFLAALVLQNDILAMQLISLVTLFCSAIYLRKILETIYKTNFQFDLFLVLFFLLSPYVMRFGLLVMSDMLCIAVYLFFLYHFLQFKHSKGLRSFLFAIIAGACCVYIRYASVVALLIPIIFLIFECIKLKKHQYLIYALLIFILISLPEIFLRQRFLFWNFGETNTGFAYFYVPQQWSVANFFKKGFYNMDGWQHYSYPNLLFVFQNFVHPAFIFAGVLFLFFSRKATFQLSDNKILFVIIVLYALFAAGYAYQSSRYLLFTFPLILILLYPAFARLYQLCNIPKWLKTLGIAACAGIQVFLLLYSSQTIYNANQVEKNIADTIKKEYPGRNIYTFSIDGALNTYKVSYTFFDIYRNRFDTIQPNSLFLYNDAAFTAQFEGLNPVKNLEFIQSNYQLEELENFDGGWKLFAIK
ncbi:MAG: hypothetical protein ACKVPJ_13365 [Chitinophagales bacterium]